MTLTVAVKRWWRSQLNSARRVGKEQRVHRYSDICSTQTEPEFIHRTCKVNIEKRKDLTSQTLILYPLNFPFSLKMLCYSAPNPPFPKVVPEVEAVEVAVETEALTEH